MSRHLRGALVLGGVWLALSAPAALADEPGAVALAGPSAALPLGSSQAGLGRPALGGPALGGNASVVAAARGPELAATLAARLGMAYQDAGSYLLLSDDQCRVRVYPNSHRLSLDGDDQILRGYFARGAQGVTLPGPAAAMVEAHVLGARAKRLAPAPAPVPVAVPAKPLAPAGLPKRVAPPKLPTAAASSINPDPSWVVAPTSRAWRWIVLHHSDDDSGNLDKYHRVHLGQGWEHGCGYHFVIGNGSLSGDGEVEASMRWRQQLHGAHAKTPDNLFNEHGIGICLVGDFEKGSGRPTAAQMRALVRLTQWLMDRYGIAPSDVRGHCHCKATCCPGKNFPWGELRSKLRAPAATGTRGALPLLTAGPVPTPAAAPALAQGPRLTARATPGQPLPLAGLPPSALPPHSLPLPAAVPPAAAPPAVAPDPPPALGLPPAGFAPPTKR